MELQTITYVVVGMSFALYLGIAFWARAGSTSEFYVAGGDVNPVVNGMATAADWMSAASFISMAGLIANMGYGGAVFLMGWTGGYVLLAMLLAPYLRKFGKFTVPEFIGDRFYSKTARTIAVVCLLVASITYIIGQMTGVGVAFSRFLGVTKEMGIYIGMGIVFAYAVFGGMKGITYTQVAQYCVLILAYTVPAVFISLNLTGNPFPQLGLGSNFAGGDVSLLAKLDQVVTDLGFAEYTTNSRGDMLNMFMYTVSLMIGTAGLPHVIVRFFTVRRVSDARKSAGWALVFIALLYTTAPAVGAMAKLNLHATVNTAVKSGGDLFAEESSIVYEQRPDWMKRWEVTGLLKFTDKNGDGRIQYYNDATKNEAVAAGGLAAALSTAAGLLMAISSAVSHDLIKGVFNPEISEKSELMAGKVSMAVAVFVAGYLGLNPPGFAAGTVALAFGIAGSSLFPAILMGIFSKTMNSEGAIAGMVAGLSTTLFYVFAHKGILFIKGTEFVDLVGGNNGWFGIEPNAIGTIGAIVNFVVAYTVCKMTSPPPVEVQEMVENIRIPTGAGAATGH